MTAQNPSDQPSPTARELRLANHRLGAQNEKLTEALKASREKLAEINSRLADMAEPPSTYGTLLQLNGTGKTAEVFTSNRHMRLAVSPLLDRMDLQPGATVRLGENLQVVEVTGFADSGDVAAVVEVVGDRLIVADKLGEEAIVKAARPLQSLITNRELTTGDSVVVDRRSGWAFHMIPRAEVSSLVLEEVPDVSYENIGGLSNQIEQIRDAVELPFLHPEIYRHYGLRPPKGVLLYGPPGNGKTLIAKAVANSLSKSMGSSDKASRFADSYFLNVKGPELLNKFVGETERQIRQIFERARKIAHAGKPVIVFFDEMEAIFRTRGTGVSSDMESTVVPQLLSELDGVEGLDNVIVIGASNREELIDPAILRPGRLDVKIRVDRPDQEAALDILSKHIDGSLPLAADLVAEHGGKEEAAAALCRAIAEELFRRDAAHRYVTLHLADGQTKDLYWADFVSGAMLANIVDRAKTFAIKRALSQTATTSEAAAEGGLNTADVLDAITAEINDSENLPDTTNPTEWARISGHATGRVVDITLAD